MAGCAGLGGIMAAIRPLPLARAAAATSKTFLLVPGAWHGGWCYRLVDEILTAKGHKVFRPTLTGLGNRSHLLSKNVNLDTHIADIVNLIKWENLDNVVLCGHSYGGWVIGYNNPAFRDIYTRLKSNPSWRTYEMPSGHDAMIDMPERLAEILQEVA